MSNFKIQQCALIPVYLVKYISKVLKMFPNINEMQFTELWYKILNSINIIK